MPLEIVQNSFRQYLLNFKTALAFGLLLIFVSMFSFFPNIFVSSGSIFAEYNLNELLSTKTLPLYAALALFSLFYALFLTVLVFAVRRNLSVVKVNYYLREMIQKFTTKLFIFFFFYIFILFIVATILISASVPVIAVALLLLIISLALLFVPQAVVIDEHSLPHSILNNFEFIVKHPSSFALVFVVGAVLVGIVPLIGYRLDAIQGLGSFISLLITLIFVLPFLEILKSYLYMLKFDLIKHQELLRR